MALIIGKTASADLVIAARIGNAFVNSAWVIVNAVLISFAAIRNRDGATLAVFASVNRACASVLALVISHATACKYLPYAGHHQAVVKSTRVSVFAIRVGKTNLAVRIGAIIALIVHTHLICASITIIAVAILETARPNPNVLARKGHTPVSCAGV